jgi:putative holliday junction resolvase
MISALGLDLGRKRIGVAGCDRLGWFATGLTTIHRTGFDRDIAQLQDIVRERDVTLLVIGLPYSMDGSLGPQAKYTQKLGERIGAALNLPIEFVDERFSSQEAEGMMHAEHLRPSQQKALVDRKAACIILQQWLNQRSQSDLSTNCKSSVPSSSIEEVS